MSVGHALAGLGEDESSHVRHVNAGDDGSTRFVVLETRPDSGYADSSTTYQFPGRYLSVFEPLQRGREMVGVLYEPRAGGGRQAYFGWASIIDPPRRDESARGNDLWSVHYATGIQTFLRPVPRVIDGIAVESWLRGIPLREQPARLRGRAARPLIAEDAYQIFALSGEHLPLSFGSGTMDSNAENPIAARVRRSVEIIERDRRFRKRVLEAYGYRCCLTGWGVATGTQDSLAGALVEAAHIRPVAFGGSDLVTNGLALTPTLHRMYDAGLFTFEYRANTLHVVMSSSLRDLGDALDEKMSEFPIRDGMQANTPLTASHRPDSESLAFHRTYIFQR